MCCVKYTSIVIIITLYSADKDLVYKDAIYFSVHKFVGGPGSPGKINTYTCKPYLITSCSARGGQ